MAFFITITAGFIISIIYDFFRVILHNTGKNKVKYTIIDIIFWIISGFTLIIAFYYSDNMKIRGYQFLGIFSGISVYFLFFSRYFVRLYFGIYKIFEFFFKILFTIGKFFVIMIIRILKWISYPFVKLWNFSFKVCKFFVKKLKANMKLMRKV